MKQAQLEALEDELSSAPSPDTRIAITAEALSWLLRCHKRLNKRAIPTRGPDGEVYVSQTALAFKLGVRQSTVANRLNTLGTMEGYGTSNGKLGNTNAKSYAVDFGGVKWPTITACAKDLGRQKKTVARWLREDREKLMAAVIKYKREKAEEEQRALHRQKARIRERERNALRRKETG